MHLLKCIMLFSATVNFQQNSFSWKQNAFKRYWNKRNMLLLLWQNWEYFKCLLCFDMSSNVLPSLMNKNFRVFPHTLHFSPKKFMFKLWLMKYPCKSLLKIKKGKWKISYIWWISFSRYAFRIFSIPQRATDGFHWLTDIAYSNRMQ